MAKNSKKTKDKSSEDAESIFSIITSGLEKKWEERQKKQQNEQQQQKKLEEETKAKRSIAGKKAAQTRKKRNAQDLRSEFAVSQITRKGILHNLNFIQKDLDKKLDEMGEEDDQKIDISYVQAQLENSNFFTRIAADKIEYYKKQMVAEIFTKYFRISFKQLMDEDKNKLVGLQADRICYQLKLAELDEDMQEIQDELKKLNIEPDKKTESQIKWESQMSKCKTTEVALKKLLKHYFKNKSWYNERLNANGRKHIETDPKRKRLGITEKAKNNDVSAIDDFGFNDFLAVFGYDIVNEKKEYNQDLVLEVFGLGNSMAITGSNRIFIMIKEIKGYENTLKHKDGNPLLAADEELLYNNCDFIQKRIKKYLNK